MLWKRVVTETDCMINDCRSLNSGVVFFLRKIDMAWGMINGKRKWYIYMGKSKCIWSGKGSYEYDRRISLLIVRLLKALRADLVLQFYF